MNDQTNEIAYGNVIHAESLFRDVGAFHAKFDLPRTGEGRSPRLMPFADYKYRLHFMQEELGEFIAAHASGNLAEAADALADLVWVALGTAHYMGIPFDQVWAEVRRANMEKRPWQEGDPVKPRNEVKNVAGEVVKPKGWRGPDVWGVIQTYKEKLFGES